MEFLVVDANVIFSCLLKGKALEILFELYDKGIKLISPEYFVEEFGRNIDKLSKQSKLSKEELLAFASILFSEFVEIVPKDRYERFLEEAKKISPDNKDIPYFALSLAFNKAPIWSREPKLKKQDVVKILFDDEVKEEFEITV